MRSPVEELWRRSVDAAGEYVRAVGMVTNDYVRALGAVGRRRLDVRRERATATFRAHASELPPPSAPPPDAAASQAAAIVLEAERGGVALGAFVVENAFGREVEVSVVASPLRGPDGELEPAASFEPAQLVLAPGEQAVVRVALAIDERMEPGLPYRGELSVPTLPGTRIPIVARRTLAG